MVGCSVILKICVMNKSSEGGTLGLLALNALYVLMKEYNL